MECKYCGKKLIDGAEYCVYCGKKSGEEHKERVKKVKKPSNNNPVVVIILIVLLLAILFGGGFFVYKKFVVKPKNKNNDVVDKPVEEKEKVPSITKEEAKSLIDTYYFAGRSAKENLFTISIDDAVKKTIAIKNIYDNAKIIACDQIEGFALEGDICTNGKEKTTQGRTVDYDILNNKYKYLFGKDSTDISKEDIKSLNEITTWTYNVNKNNFLETFLITGFESADSHVVYDVKDYSQEKDKLIVKVGYILLDPKEENGKVMYSIKIGEEEVKYSLEEVSKDSFNSEFINKYLDKLDTYEITFKYEDDHYIFESIKKS